jgi:hypothetical protein
MPFRFMIVVRWFFLIAACAVLAWLGWYGYAKGLGRHWRSLLEKEFARYGLAIDVGKITLDPFRGLIARDVQIFESQTEENLLAEINQVSLDVNYANLFQHGPALNAVDLSGASLRVPLNFRAPHSGKARVTDFHARIYFLPGRIEVRQASALLYGIRVNASATLVNPRSLSQAVAEVANDPDPSDATVWFVSRLFNELKKIRYRQAANLNFSFQMDLANPRDWRIDEGSFLAPDLERNGEELKDLAAKFGFENHHFVIRSLHLADERGELFGVGTWDVTTGQKKFQLRSTLDLARLLRDEPDISWIREWAFEKAPEIEVQGELLRNWEPKIIGKLNVDQFSVRGVHFQGLRAEFSRQGASWMLSNVELTHRTGTLTGEILDRREEFRIRLHSALNPRALVSLLPLWALPLFADWEFQAPPVIQLNLSGPSPRQLEGTGQFWLGQSRFRGVSMNSCEGSFRLNHSSIWFENLRIARDEGSAAGSFVLNLRSKRLEQVQGEAHLQPNALAGWLEPALVPLIEQFRFSKTPVTKIESPEAKENSKVTLQINAVAPFNYRSGRFDLPLNSAVLLVQGDSDQANLSISGGQMSDGRCSILVQRGGSLSGSPTKSVVTFDQASLGDLANQFPILEGCQGKLNGSLKTSVSNADPIADRVDGKLSFTGVDLHQCRFFEHGSRQLLAAGFGVTGDLSLEFRSDIGQVIVNRFTVSSGGHLLDLSGSLITSSDTLKLSGLLDDGAATVNVSGDLNHPDWEIISSRPN